MLSCRNWKRLSAGSFSGDWNEGDIKAAADFLAPEFTSHNSFEVSIVGPLDYGQAVRQYRQAFPDLVTTLADVFAAGDRVAARGIEQATHRVEFMGRPPSGRTVRTTWIEIFRLENGKAVEGWLETNMQQLLDQLT